MGILFWIIYLLFGLAYTGFWVYTLVKQGQSKQWVWFWFTIIFGTIPLLLWWFVGRESVSQNFAAKNCRASGGKWKNNRCVK